MIDINKERFIEKEMNKIFFDIADLAMNNVTDIHDGIVQLDKEKKRLIGCSMTSTEKENPLNNCIELYRLKAGFDPKDPAGCWYCFFEPDCHSENVDECCANVLYDWIKEEKGKEIEQIIKQIKRPNIDY